MTKQVNLYEAKTHLSQLVDEAAAGEEIVIAKNGKPLAVLKAVTEAEKPKKREFGFLAGKVKSPTDEEWAEMDREVLEIFEESINRPLFPEPDEELTQQMVDERDRKPSGR
jgi:prevent-host-death family protein